MTTATLVIVIVVTVLIMVIGYFIKYRFNKKSQTTINIEGNTKKWKWQSWKRQEGKWKSGLDDKGKAPNYGMHITRDRPSSVLLQRPRYTRASRHWSGIAHCWSSLPVAPETRTANKGNGLASKELRGNIYRVEVAKLEATRRRWEKWWT
jgi:hypothetical protein